MGFERTPFQDRICPDRIRGTCALAAFAVLLLASCAVPVAPTGGPADDTPPRLIAGSPTDGSTGFSGRTIELTFSEHVDRQSLPGAVSLQPEPGGRLEFDWHGRTVEITLPEDLRPETTYILSIDNSLRDARNVALDRPITLAFATGSTIDAGQLAGRVVRAYDGAPGAGIDVYAYAAPDSALFLDRPLYRTQTARDGTFAFSYLRETEYFVVGVRDRNGNRRLDSNEDLALPPVSSIRADTMSAELEDAGLVWVLDRHDDIPPSIDRISSAGPNHVELRFSEPVRLQSAAAPELTLSDAAGEPITIRSVYSTGPHLNRTIGLYTDDLTQGAYTLSGPFPVVDSTGNAAVYEDFEFELSDSAGRSRPRVASVLPDSSAGVRFRSIPDADPDGAGAGSAAAGQDAGTPVRVWPGDSAGVRFDIPAPHAVADGLIAARDTSGGDLSDRFRLSTPTTWTFDDTSFAAPFELILPPAVTAADTSVVLAFVRAGRALTGELSGTIVTRPSTDDARGRVVVELYRDKGGVSPSGGSAGGSRDRAQSTAGGSKEPPLRSIAAQGRSFMVSGLPDGLRVRLRAFIDMNANGTWDAGQAVPFVPPEPITWMRAAEPVRARWETALSDTLTFHIPD